MSAPLDGRFAGRTAIVTGAGSGIGAALSRALADEAAVVYCADIDLASAERTVAGIDGADASARQLDVTDAAAVQALVDEVVAEHGRLDLMFNNAGITLGGETEDITLAQWDQIIDVNIRGVVHGVAAAYPQMIRQGDGHIINTASMGGLMAAGLLTTYVTTKHAVVGLSLALRSEAAAKGVRVTVVCPSAVDTPILDKGEVGLFNGRDYYLKGQGIRHPLSPERLAAEVVAAVASNKAMVVTPRASRIAWRIGRLSPRFVQWSSVRFVSKQRRLQQQRARSLAPKSR